MIKVPKKAIFDYRHRKSPKIPPMTQDPNENPDINLKDNDYNDMNKIFYLYSNHFAKPNTEMN